MISMERKLFQAITTQFSNYLLENSILSHFSLFVPAYEQPLYYIFAFIDENGIIGCCCNDISKKEKATPGYFHPIFPTFAWKFNFWPFFTICTYSRAPLWSNLCFYWQNYYHWVQLQWYLRKESNFMLLPLLFPAICLKISIFGHFWPFFTICACSWVTPWGVPWQDQHLRMNWPEFLSWGWV